MRVLALAFLMALPGCTAASPQAPVARVLSFKATESRSASPAPVIEDAAKAQSDATDYFATRDDATAQELFRVLDLGSKMRRAVVRLRAHRTPGNLAAARASVRELRAAIKR